MTYNKTKRRHFSSNQRKAFFALHGGICYWCSNSIDDDEPWDIEHVIARELMDGKHADDDSNLKPIHRLGCHPAKSALDKKIIAKSNRIRRENGPVEDRKKRTKVPQRKNAWPPKGSIKFPKKPT